MKTTPKWILTATLFSALSAQAFELKSPDLQGKALSAIPETHVFNSFGCTGQNLSPALEWKNAPKGTQSFALTMYDPDAPTGSGWWHWIVVNLPKDTTKLARGAALPAGALQTKNDFGNAAYDGPCPPKGKPHRYVFTLYALKVPKLDLDPNTASGAMAGYNILGNAIGKAQLNAKYQRR